MGIECTSQQSQTLADDVFLVSTGSIKQRIVFILLREIILIFLANVDPPLGDQKTHHLVVDDALEFLRHNARGQQSTSLVQIKLVDEGQQR